MSKSFLPKGGGPDGRNPIQKQAAARQQVRFRGPDGKLKSHPVDQVPQDLAPHPNVTPELGHQEPLPEDRPAGSPPTP